MKWLFFIAVCMYAVSFSGCSSSSEDNGDSDSKTNFHNYSDTDSYRIASTDATVDSAQQDSDEAPDIDTNDNIGGADEECYTYDADGTTLMWCDTPDLVMQQCEDYTSGCCCRAPCEPAMCDGSEETLPCTAYDSQNLSGYCDYAVDNVPVTYECEAVCTPRSACATVDTDGVCLDSDAGLTGICLYGGEEDNSQLYCLPSCTMSSCDEKHFCSPLYENGFYDGTGACLPR